MENFIHIFSLVLMFIMGMQISIQDLKLLKGNINYKRQLTNYIAYICFVIIIGVIIYDIINYGILICLPIGLFILIYAITGTWMLSKLNIKSFWINTIIIIIMIMINVFILNYLNIILYSTTAFWALYYRNTPFGSPYRKQYLLLSSFKRKRKIKNIETTLTVNGIDYSFAGKKEAFKQLPIYNVKDFGIYPNTGKDLTKDVQKLIDKIGSNGGGEIFFPKGKYEFNKNSKNINYICINNSHIHIRGELSKRGKPLSIFINCNPTLIGNKNPWLSPFFITTGEKIQRSNIFWGLQFLKKKNIFTKSQSLSDPGSDGIILTPDYITEIINESQIGDDVITLKDTSLLNGMKYIMIGMYNTDKDGNLIKEILGVEKLLPEWGTALRAGEEQAPSLQFLVGIETIIDKNHIKLTRPLLHHIQMKYIPKIFSVPMLEDICIKDLAIESKWNGLFRHHGYPKYYSVKQSQEMDYGWNAINLKRVAHGGISNVIIKNFTNPIYIMDSINNTIENIIIEGEDGHQGIKLYEHACNNLFYNISFYNHYADMMGGEGNAYGNVFYNIFYNNPYFKPVDYDFHGFSEGPMSPPAYNLFINCFGFRSAKGAGASYNLPGSAQNNVWINCPRNGNIINSDFFVNLPCKNYYYEYRSH